MRIGINLYHLQAGVGGIGNFVLTLLREWPERFPEDPLVLFAYDHNRADLAALVPARGRQIHFLRSQRGIRPLLRQADLFFCPFGVLWPRPVPVPTVVLLMDVQERYHPEFFGQRELRDRFFHYTWSLRMADRVIAISDFAARTFVDRVGLDAGKISRIYLCADELPHPAVRPALPATGFSDFALYPANTWRHKNHPRFFRALRRLRDEGIAVPCVCTGAQIPGTPPLSTQADAAGVADQVHHLGRVSRAELTWLYEQARVLVLPSLFEGFGIPLVEAMQCGLPIACSRAASLPEVAGDAALYFDPEQVDSMAGVLRRAWTDAAARDVLSAAGRARAGLFGVAPCLTSLREAFERASRDFSRARHWRRRLFWAPVSRLWNLPGCASLALRAAARLR